MNARTIVPRPDDGVGLVRIPASDGSGERVVHAAHHPPLATTGPSSVFVQFPDWYPFIGSLNEIHRSAFELVSSMNSRLGPTWQGICILGFRGPTPTQTEVH